MDVQITQPLNGAVVSGVISIEGTSQDVGSGRVSISIDGGPFDPAVGIDPWSYSLDTTSLSNGMHNIRARARQSLGGAAVFDEIDVDVQNGGGGSLSVTITSPEDGAVLLDTFLVRGQSQGATLVTLAVDGGPFGPVNGLNPWDMVFEPGSLSPGFHTLTAKAEDGVGTAFDQITIEIGDPPVGGQQITYASSVDGEPLGAELYLPVGFNPHGPPVPLVMHLHGGGGTGNFSPDMTAELDARGWIGIAPDGRDWGLADIGCTWQTSAAYVNNPDPNVGPGEQDMLDAIDWAALNFPIDLDRVYLTGFSMGGRGSYIIGLKNPDLFAAIAPLGPAIDMFEVYIRRPEPRACKEGMVGGEPGDSPFVDTMYSITSGRFLIENAFNLPVFHGHGLLDTTANNTPANAPFLHGWHITEDASWSACHSPALCFGHTPVLEELHGRHPEGYDWAFMFTPVGHSTDPKWLHGTPINGTDLGVEDPQNPGNLIGMFEFFDRRSLQHNPETVVYKSYTDEHTRAFWVEMDISTPWLNKPGAVRVSRVNARNRLEAELVRVAEIAFDLGVAGLELRANRPLSLQVQPLVEPTFDPALVPDPGEVLTPSLVLRGDFSRWSQLGVWRDGQRLSPAEWSWNGSEVRLENQFIDSVTEYRIAVLPSQAFPQ